ncbi:major capsid protein [Apis mellifera associated microvirus 58]|nr:major capsid protein [Apis mellifera associated microvirus 58]
MNLFNSVKMTRPKGNTFDLSHDLKFSLDAGKLIPIINQAILPGDSWNLSAAQMIRVAPMIAPIMHRVDVYTHFFFVPNRLLWKGWQEFITGGNGNDPAPVHPYVILNNKQTTVGKLTDYLGIPTVPPASIPVPNPNTKVSALDIAAVGLVRNEYYMDQNLQTPWDVELNDGDNTSLLVAAGLIADGTTGVGGDPFRRSWEHDYFTAALPEAQKGPAATLPLGSEADIIFDPNGDPSKVFDVSGNPLSINGHLGKSGSNDLITEDALNPGTFVDTTLDNSAQLKADLSTATAATINVVRLAFQLQRWLERNNIAGSRYIETILAHFGVRSSDKTLQRPQYLGGGKSPVMISEVLQTSESVTTPQGNLAGHGLNVGQSHNFTTFFEEHGILLGFISVMPKPAYQQGLPRNMFKFDRIEYYWPSFDHIGEQAIKGREIFLTGDQTYDDKDWGYIPRYSEYRYIPSRVAGDYKETLSYWHWGRIFSNEPELNEEFILCDPTKRPFAVQDLPDSDDPNTPVRDWNTMYCHVVFQIKATRRMSKYATPI